MEQPNPETKLIHSVQQILLHSIIPVMCSAAIGFLYYRWNVFDPGNSRFQFVHSAALASIFYYSLTYTGKKNAFAILLALFLAVLLESHSTRLMYVLRDFFYTAGIAVAVLLYVRQLRMNPTLRGQYLGLVFSGITGVCTVLAWSLQYFFVQFVFKGHPPIPFLYFIWIAAFYGFMTGLGVGAGIVINQMVFDRPNRANNAI